MIKVGQVYEYEGNICVITNIFHNSLFGRDWAYFIYKNGESDHFSTLFMGNYFELIAEYPSWQEAVNSKEFKE